MTPYAIGTAVVLIACGLGLLALTARAWRRGGKQRIAHALALAGWGGAVAVPGWMSAHPPAPLFDGILGGDTREVESHPAPRNDLYWLDVARSGTAWEGEYWLRVDVGGAREVHRAQISSAADRYEVSVRSGNRVRLFAERAGGGLAIRLYRAPPDRTWLRFALLVALLLAMAADLVAARERGDLVGGATWLVSTSCLFALVLPPNPDTRATAVVGALVASAVAGGILAAVWGALVGRRLRRGRR